VKFLRLFAPLLALGLALLAGGCGGGDSKQAKDILRRGFAASIPSANITIDLTGKLDGIAQLSRPVRVQLAGPYRSNGSKSIPSVSWNVSISGGGQVFSTGLLSTGDRAFVNFQGTAYRLDQATVADLNKRWTSRRSGGSGSLTGLGLHPLAWVQSASMQGDSDIAGVKTQHVSATLDVAKMLADLNHLEGATVSAVAKTPKLSQHDIDAIKKVVQNPSFDVYVGKSDNRIRRIAASLDFKVPSNQRARLRGLKGGTVSLSIELAGVGEPQRIVAPAKSRPISDLRKQLTGLSSLGAH
jgi:hypothetical protein